MILVRSPPTPSSVWNVVDIEDIDRKDSKEGHFVAFKGDSVSELIVFLKSVKPRRIFVHLEDEGLFRSISSAFTPDNVIRVSK